MTRLRMLGIAAAATAITALAIVAVNAFVPWVMHAVLSNPRLAAFLSHLSWMIPISVAVFMPMTYAWYRRRARPAVS